MGEGPGEPREVRDATGFVVGSPDWLELQRMNERARSSGIARPGMWRVGLGVMIIAISLVTTLSVATSDEDLGLRPSSLYGWVVIAVLPLLVGLLLIQRGRSMRGGGPREVLTTLPPSARSTAPDGGSPPATPPAGPS